MKSRTGTCITRGISGLLLACALARGQGESQPPPPDSGAYELSSEPLRYSQNPGAPWPAVDELGRALPTAAEVGSPRPNRFAGIFYFLWLGQHEATDKQPFVVTDILRQHPDALKNPGSPPWGPEGSPHFWGEPLFGFYLVSDPWVLRRHAHLLADAGIDTLIFDATNTASYHEVYLQLCETFRQVRAEGGRTPQIAFMVNTEAGETAEEIYEDLYKPGLYQDLWFRWKGKPLMICDPVKASAELRSFFTLRRAHWPFTQVNTPYAWHWEAAYPQPYGFTDDPKAPEQVNVSVAQNLRQSDGKVTNMSNGDARGRSFHNGSEDSSSGAIDRGYNFQEQWERAIQLDPPFVMVTGWNEWIAGRFARPGHDVVFVDQFNEEFSRDIEMMRGGHGDDYYYQLASNVRRFKGMPGIRKGSQAKAIHIDAGFFQWRDVGPEYRDHIGETIPRNYDGVAKLHYANHTGRNDLELMKVARDDQNVYFYARTREPISSWKDRNWMMLLIDTDADPKTGWKGYDFIVNRSLADKTTTVLEKNAGGWSWTKAAEIPYHVDGRELELAIPRAALGLANGKTDFTLDFKWVDNMQKPGDIMDFYVNGDVAPDGRFNYRYTTR
jgi:hypothetical protein